MKIIKSSSILLVALTAITFSFSGHIFANGYIGSEKCARCHQKQYNLFRISGHPYKLMKAEDAKKRAIPLPAGYRWSDISYVIGGAYKKARYIDLNGYIITAAKDGSVLKTQYNLETGAWSYYHKGEKKPYTCGKCHTTGFNKTGHQDGIKGLIGTWSEPGVQCEACHGPGSEHAKTTNKSSITIDRSSAACGKCHSRGTAELIPAKKGFIRHHEQYNELMASPHKALNCVTCHEPHTKYTFSIKKDCSSCHMKQTTDYKDSAMQKVGVQCIDCHMPKATKSATAQNKYQADIRTHLFKINTSKNVDMFYQKKVKGKVKSFSRNFITPGFSCLSCHKNKDMEWATFSAKGIHKLGK